MTDIKIGDRFVTPDLSRTYAVDYVFFDGGINLIAFDADNPEFPVACLEMRPEEIARTGWQRVEK